MDTMARTTLGMTVACITKAVLMSTKLNKMVETGIGSRDWADNIIHKVSQQSFVTQGLRVCLVPSVCVFLSLFVCVFLICSSPRASRSWRPART